VTNRKPNLSPDCFACRNRADIPTLVVGALHSDEADEMEEERDDRDESETMDSGEDAVETVLARDVRRCQV